MTDQAPAETGLTPKQAAFVREYLLDLNATQAAIRAGYSETTAYSIGHENLSKPEIAEAIAVAQAERAARTGVTADRVLQELAKIGFSDVRKLFTDDGQLIPITDLDDATAASISSVEVVSRRVVGATDEQEDQGHGGSLKRSRATEVEGIHKVKTYDKIGALTQIGRHLGMFTDKTIAEVSGELRITKVEREIVRPPHSDS